MALWFVAAGKSPDGGEALVGVDHWRYRNTALGDLHTYLGRFPSNKMHLQQLALIALWSVAAGNSPDAGSTSCNSHQNSALGGLRTPQERYLVNKMLQQVLCVLGRIPTAVEIDLCLLLINKNIDLNASSKR